MIRRFAALFLTLAIVPDMAVAEGDGWRTERFNIVVRDQGIRDVLRQFGVLAGVPVVISDAVEAQVSARFEDASGEEVIDAIAREYGLDWRYDGRRLEISSNAEQVSRILDMGGVARDDLVDALMALDAYEARFRISAIDGELAMLVGPPRYVAIVEIVLAELVEKKAEQEAIEAKRRVAIEARRLVEEERRQRAHEEARRRAEESRRLAEERRLEEERRLQALQEQRERLAASQEQSPVPEVPLVNRGGRWGG